MRVERRTFVRERAQAVVLHLSGVRPQQPGQNAHEAGFADTVGPGKLQSPAALEFKPHALKQQPVAASAGKITGGKTARLHRPSG